MLYSKYLIRCEFKEDGALNNFKGSALRGAFGYALKKAVCTVHMKECENCILNRQCLYAKFFIEQNKSRDNQSSRQAPSIPHPYIIEPPLSKKNNYCKGEEFEFHLILLGDSYNMLPFIIYAFELMGEKGIGRSRSEDKKNASFVIKDVLECHADFSQIYLSNEKRLLVSSKPLELRYSDVPILQSESQFIEITLETPLRFKSENQLSAALDFEQFYRLMVRRVKLTFSEFSDQCFELDYKKLLEIARTVEIQSSSLNWEDQLRYSNKQHAKLKLGGLIGKIIYKGNILPFLPLLDLATLLHLGKQTSFGLGKINYLLKGSL